MAAPILNSWSSFPITEVRTPAEASIPATSSTLLLTRRLVKREEAAFREFHAIYFDRLYRFLLVLYRGQVDDAEEALQETLLRVARYVRVFDTEEVFWSWLKRVARSSARDRGRKQSRYLAFLQRFALRWPVLSAQSASGEDDCLQEALEESLAELGAEDRCLIEDKYLEELTVKELSLRTGLTGKAVESRLLRLRRRLRQSILKKIRLR